MQCNNLEDICTVGMMHILFTLRSLLLGTTLFASGMWNDPRKVIFAFCFVGKSRGHVISSLFLQNKSDCSHTFEF